MSENKLKVLFIAGCGRSGTTVLGQLLGEVEKWLNVGEAVRYLFDRSKELPCGCGASAFECSLWKDIIGSIPSDVAQKATQALRIRNFPSLYMRTRNQQVPEGFQPILDTISSAYSKVAQATGCDVIVDTSKYPGTALLASLIPDVELHVVHVVRSPHSVIASWTSKKGYLAVHPPSKVVTWWWAYNVLSEALKSRCQTYRLVRYEDFARDPGTVLSQITADVMGEPVPLPFMNGNTATVHVQHSLAGNPSKFNTGEIKIQEGGKSAPKRKLLMDLLTFPLQARYHYLPATQKP